MDNGESDRIFKGFLLNGFEIIIYHVATVTSMLLGFYRYKNHKPKEFTNNGIVAAITRVDIITAIWWGIEIALYAIAVNFRLPQIGIMVAVIAALRIVNIISYSWLNILPMYLSTTGKTTYNLVHARRSLFLP